MKQQSDSRNQVLPTKFVQFPMNIQLWSQTSMTGDGHVQSICGLKIMNKGHKNNSRKASNYNGPSAHRSTNAEVAYVKLDFPKYECRYCYAALWREEKSKATGADNITSSICCQGGKVLLQKFQRTPEPLYYLLRDPGTEGETFKKKIRIYNSMFSFTSFGGRIDEKLNISRGPYTFRISGQNYHRIGSLIPEQGDPPRYSQLYFYDTGNERKNRMACMNLNTSDVDESVVQQLIAMLDTHNCVSQAFRMARDWSVENPAVEVSLQLIGEREKNRKQYNLPTVPEVAALIVGDFGRSDAPRDVIIHSKSKGPQRISELHPQYMALQYPLLFPHGEDGFHVKIEYKQNSGNRKTKRAFVTMREYYCYMLQQRIHEGTTLIQGGRLFHQYLVDAYTAIEEQRLRWIRFNQDELRAELYNNICDAVSKGDTEGRTIGKRIVLPATFTGGPRYMVQNYQDAMALCRAFGNPSLFITFTSNPKWPEIEDMLKQLPQQSPNDRPEIITRVFKLKLMQLMEDVRKKEIFGKATAAVYTIEFQKRGLPHVHILLWLDSGNTAKTASDIDEVISAEIPCIYSDPVGHKCVISHMLHGPCGPANKKSPCMVIGQCNKKFPKPFYEETTMDEDGFPVYRRRNNGRFVEKGKAKLDNRHVVPYNRYLLIKYDAHINVEWCNRSRAIKYLFKYISKGPDRATALFTQAGSDSTTSVSNQPVQVDEIKQYLECRYLSACEAAWRIFSFDIHYCTPPVMRLTFHLQEQNSVTLRDTDNLPALMHREDLKKTMFTEWLTLNQCDSEARTHTYAEIPRSYVWNADERRWTPRKQRTSVGRIVYSHPASGERYYLRMLLNVVKGPRTFDEIRTVNGSLQPTFKQACYALGMLNDDKEWTDAIQEANIWASAAQLRELFVTILLFCEVTSPRQLWERNWEALSDDILYKRRKQFQFPDLELTDHQRQNYCLMHIQDILSRNGKSLSDYPDLPIPDKNLLTQLDNRLIQEELNYNIAELEFEHEKLYSALNQGQLKVYNRVLNSVNNQLGQFFFLYGPGGTGKTFLYTTIMARLRSERNIVLAVASSGIASLLLAGGRTAHSRFLIPLELMENSTCGITQNSHLAHLLQEVTLIIWDEAPMTQRHAFEALNRTLQDIRGVKQEENRSKLFGGITVLLGGDFRQILPVITKGKRQEVIQACINNSPLWGQCELLTLSHNMRVNAVDSNGQLITENQRFNQWLLKVGNGEEQAISIEEEEDEESWIKIPQRYIIQPHDDPVQQIIEETFGDLSTHISNRNFLQERAILTPLNEDADRINDRIFERIKGQISTYKSSDEVCMASTDVADQEHMYPTEFLNSLDFPGMTPHILKLKQGLPVMLLRNVNPTQGLCNGTRLIITHLGKWVIEAEIITGNKVGNRVLIPRITMSSAKSKWPFVMRRRQFPVKPCFAMTINKSQGQSLKYVGLYLPKPVFSHGQLYVAFSRVTDPTGLKVLIIPSRNDPHGRTKNIVFKEVFNNLSQGKKGEAQEMTIAHDATH